MQQEPSGVHRRVHVSVRPQIPSLLLQTDIDHVPITRGIFN